MISVESRKLSSGERKLLVAMLERAVFDYFGNQAFDREEAAEWLFSDHESDEAFSFGWVCTQLELDPLSVLERLRRMSPRQGTSTQQWWAQNSALN